MVFNFVIQISNKNMVLKGRRKFYRGRCSARLLHCRGDKHRLHFRAGTSRHHKQGQDSRPPTEFASGQLLVY